MFIIIFLLVIIVDQYTKLLVRQEMFLGQSKPLIDGVLHLTYVQNTGGAFGILRQHTHIFIAVSILVIGFMLYYLVREKKKDFFHKFIFSLILGGAISNLIDRVLFGHVVDFIDVLIWPVFNFADMAISVSIVLLIFHTVFKKESNDVPDIV